MKPITIYTRNPQKPVYQGTFETVIACLETAIREGVSLAGTDLSHLMLMHANLDGADLSGVLFDGSDLTGANLSECNLADTSLRGVDLSLSALCESHMVRADFTGASFAGTLIDGAVIEDCRFTCPTALALPYKDAAHLGRNYYGAYLFTAAPVVVTGLPRRIVFLDDVVLVGDMTYPRLEFPNPFENLFKESAPIGPRRIDGR